MVFGQEGGLEFEVATIKPSGEVHAGGLIPSFSHGRMRAQNVAIKQLIASAFEITDPQIVSTQRLRDDRFDLLAIAPPETSDEQAHAMLRSLLADRFHLQSHFEKRMMRVYLLTSLKSGLEVRPNPLIDDHERPTGAVIRGLMTTAKLAEILSRMLERPVLDQTGTRDRYRISLMFAPPYVPPGVNIDSSAIPAPDIATALKEQLGLSLRQTQSDVQVLVIDHVDSMPTPN